MPKVRRWAFVDAIYCDIDPLGVRENTKAYCTPLEVALQAPHTVSLFGYVYDDERYNPETTEFQDGHRIITSRLETVDLVEKKQVTTRSGSVYQLDGDCHKIYTEFLTSID
jgi:hypothetical protein